MKHIIIVIIFISVVLFSPAVLLADFDFDDMQAVEKTEQTELLEKAKDAAKRYRFNKAEQYVEQAKQKAYSPEAVSETLKIIEKNRDQYEEEQRREREIAERKKKEERERMAAAARNSGGSYSSSGGNSPQFITVKAARIAAGIMGGYVKKLTLSGGSGQFSSNGSSSMVSIFKGYNGKLAGNYSYVAEFDNGKACSGSFYVSGNKENVYLQIYDNCSGSVNEH